MSGKRYTPEDVIRKLREADVLLSQGVTVAEVVRRLGVNKVTCYRWRKEFGGMKADQARRLKDLERENARLRARADRAEGLVEIQKKVSEILGIELKRNGEKD